MRNIVELLKYEGTRKPEIQAYIDNISEMSADDIDSLPVPLPWYKTALHELRKIDQYQRLSEIVLDHVIDGFVPEQYGYCYRWNLNDTFIKSGKFDLEVKQGQLVFVSDQGMWIGSTFIEAKDGRVLKQPCLGSMTRTEYRDLIYKEYDDPQTLITNPRLAQFGVRVSSSKIA